MGPGEKENEGMLTSFLVEEEARIPMSSRCSQKMTSLNCICMYTYVHVCVYTHRITCVCSQLELELPNLA